MSLDRWFSQFQDISATWGLMFGVNALGITAVWMVDRENQFLVGVCTQALSLSLCLFTIAYVWCNQTERLAKLRSTRSRVIASFISSAVFGVSFTGFCLLAANAR